MDAGVEPGDVIIGLDGKKVIDTSHLQRLVGWTPPGRAVTLDVVRYGRRKNLTVKLAKLPDAPRPKKSPPPAAGEKDPGRKTYGIDLESLTPELMKKNQIKTAGGVLIQKVVVGSRAFRDGLRSGMVIREFTYRAPGTRTAPVRVSIRHLDDFEKILGKIPPGSNVLARVVRGSIRGERTFFMVIRSIRAK